MDDKNFKTLKQIFSQLETSGGKNINHKTITKGIHKDDTAIGEYGLMPKSIQTQARRNIRDGVATPLDYAIADTDSKSVTEMIKRNPEAEKYYAETMMKRSLNAAKGDPKDAYFKWVYGDEANLEEVKPRDTNNIEKRFSKVLDYLAPMSKAPEKTFEIPALEEAVNLQEPEKELLALTPDKRSKARDIASPSMIRLRKP